MPGLLSCEQLELQLLFDHLLLVHKIVVDTVSS
jgi:hypothetical protein